MPNARKLQQLTICLGILLIAYRFRADVDKIMAFLRRSILISLSCIRYFIDAILLSRAPRALGRADSLRFDSVVDVLCDSTTGNRVRISIYCRGNGITFGSRC